jgi:hypothetical protein
MTHNCPTHCTRSCENRCPRCPPLSRKTRKTVAGRRLTVDHTRASGALFRARAAPFQASTGEHRGEPCPRSPLLTERQRSVLGRVLGLGVPRGGGPGNPGLLTPAAGGNLLCGRSGPEGARRCPEPGRLGGLNPERPQRQEWYNAVHKWTEASRESEEEVLVHLPCKASVSSPDKRGSGRTCRPRRPGQRKSVNRRPVGSGKVSSAFTCRALSLAGSRLCSRFRLSIGTSPFAYATWASCQNHRRLGSTLFGGGSNAV